jgi:SAM-dependent methyltransferase
LIVKDRFGKSVDLEALSIKEIIKFHFYEELYYSNKIKKSMPSSLDREEVTRKAYSVVHNIANYSRHPMYSKKDSHGFKLGYFLLLTSVLRKIDPKSYKKREIFEVGFGSGVLLKNLYSNGFLNLSGCEPDKNQFIKLGAKILKKGTFFNKTIMQCRLKNNSFDVIYSNDVYEHLHPDETQNFLMKLYRSNKKGGALILITPLKWTGPHDITRLYLGRGFVAKGLHLKEYCLFELIRDLKNSGYSKISVPYFRFGKFYFISNSHKLLKLKIWIEKMVQKKFIPYPIKKFIYILMAFDIVIGYKY